MKINPLLCRWVMEGKLASWERSDGVEKVKKIFNLFIYYLPFSFKNDTYDGEWFED